MTLHAPTLSNIMLTFSELNLGGCVSTMNTAQKQSAVACDHVTSKSLLRALNGYLTDAFDCVTSRLRRSINGSSLISLDGWLLVGLQATITAYDGWDSTAPILASFSTAHEPSPATASSTGQDLHLQ